MPTYLLMLLALGGLVGSFIAGFAYAEGSRVIGVTMLLLSIALTDLSILIVVSQESE